MSALIVRNVDRNHAFGIFDRSVIQVWRGECTLRAVQQLAELAHELVAEHAGFACCNLSVIESSSPPPSDRVRPLLTAFYRELAPYTRQPLVVAEGSGFRAAIVRGVGLTVSVVAPSFLPFKFASTVEEAAKVMAPSLSAAAGGAPGVIDAVAALRAELDRVAG